MAALQIYGGGGTGFLMLVHCRWRGSRPEMPARPNVLASVLNVSAVAIFCFFSSVQWLSAAIVCGGALVGGLCGAWMLKRVNERLLRTAIVGIGIALTIGLFVEPV